MILILCSFNKNQMILIFIRMDAIRLALILSCSDELCSYMELFMIFMIFNCYIGYCYSIMNLMVNIYMFISMIYYSIHSTLIILVLIHFYVFFYSFVEYHHYFLFLIIHLY